MFRPLVAFGLMLAVWFLPLAAERPRQGFRGVAEALPATGDHAISACRIACRAALTLFIHTPRPADDTVFQAVGSLTPAGQQLASLGPEAFGLTGPAGPPDSGPAQPPLLAMAPLAAPPPGGLEPAYAPAPPLIRTGGAPRAVAGGPIGGGPDGRARPLSPALIRPPAEIPLPASLTALLGAMLMLGLLARQARKRRTQAPVRTRLAG